MRRNRIVCGLIVAMLCSVAGQAGAQKGNIELPRGSVTIGPPPRSEVAEVTTVQGMEIRRENYPIVDGSTSTQWLGRLLGSYMLGAPGELRRVPNHYDSRGPQSTVLMTYPLEASDQQIAEVQKTIKNYGTHYGTHEAYEGLIDGKADLILVAREPSPDEIQAAREKNVELDIRPIALDALVFLVNEKNPVTSLSLEQIRQIYTGKTTSWKDVGGEDKEILAYTRDRNSGSEELMTKLVMQDRKIIQGGDRMMMTMAGVIDGVARNPESLAYSVYYYAQIMNPSTDNRLLGVDGVLPTTETISNRQYPLVEPTYAIIRKDAKPDSVAVQWRDWLLSDEGQMLVAASGFAPVKPLVGPDGADAAQPQPDAPQPQPEAPQPQ